MELLLTKMPPYGLCFYAYIPKGEEEVEIGTDCPRKAKILRCLKRVPKWITSALEEGKWVKLTDAQYDPTTRYIKLIGKVIIPITSWEEKKVNTFYSRETGSVEAKKGEYFIVSAEYKSHETYKEATGEVKCLETVQVPCPGVPYPQKNPHYFYRDLEYKIDTEVLCKWEGGYREGDVGILKKTISHTAHVEYIRYEKVPNSFRWDRNKLEWIPVIEEPWERVSYTVNYGSPAFLIPIENLQEEILSQLIPETVELNGTVISSKQWGGITKSRPSGPSSDGMRTEYDFWTEYPTYFRVKTENDEEHSFNTNLTHTI